ncbi:MAG TPA: hypothetical protein VKZ50_14750 [bacterium]|nr:hypothetical protein [bacterium]
MAVCSRCGKEYKPGAKGWYGRLEGLPPGGRGESPLARILLCPEDFARIPQAGRKAWHEYMGATEGPTREKRIGHLGEP